MLFDTKLISGDIGRITCAVLGVVPLISIFSAGASWRTSSDSAKDVKGRPPSWFFSFIWAIVVILLFFVVLVVAFRAVDIGAVVYITVLIMLFTILAVTWLYVYNQKGDKVGGVAIMGFVVFSSLLLMAGVSNIKYDDVSESLTKPLLSSMVSVPLTWGIYAMILNFFDIN